VQQRKVTQKYTMQNTQLVYNFLLQSNKQRTAANIAAHTQLTTQQVSSALQNLQRKKLIVVATKQHKKQYTYIALQHNAAAQYVAQIQHKNVVAKQQTMLQRIVNAIVAKFKH
jgi:DNA-binding transcriptional regulator GbsR (MarR family)